MEFLLINHPLDCPICDQGGECQLQDLAVGYGGSASRYTEDKRVVFHKNLGPLVSAEEMTRCIQCTRCVRFGQEIAGVMELGMIGRGEHAEIVAFVGKTVDSELSGNMIDLCPVGRAHLEAVPLRGAHLGAVAPQSRCRRTTALGSNLVVQVKNDRVMRVLPLENEAVNECWLSDKDRFSYEGLNSRASACRSRWSSEDGEWKTVDWHDGARVRRARASKTVVERHGGRALGALVSPHSTLEELSLAARLARALGSDNVDFRLRQTRFPRRRRTAPAFPWLGMPIADLGALDRVLVVGSFLRKDHPLSRSGCARRRERAREISSLHSVDDDSLMPRRRTALVAAPSLLPQALAEIVVAAATRRGQARARGARAASSPSPRRNVDRREPRCRASAGAILLGNFAQQHPRRVAAPRAGAGARRASPARRSAA